MFHLNSQYFIFLKNRRYISQIMHLNKQLTRDGKKFTKKFTKKQPETFFSYSLVDLKNNTEERMLLKTRILPDETQFVYPLKKRIKKKNILFLI